MSEGGPRTVGAVDTSCRILDSLRERGGAGVTELASELDLAKGAVHAHLATLLEHELVVNDGGTYRLSFRHLQLAEAAKERLENYDVVVEELDALAAETGESANFGVEEHGRLAYVYRTRGEEGVIPATVGDRSPLHATALGKAILSGLPRERVEAIVERRGLPARTPDTITDPDALFAELDAIRERGYAFDDGEVLRGVRCVALPVTGADGAVVGAVSVAAPASRVSEERVDRLREAISRAVNVIEVSTRLS